MEADFSGWATKAGLKCSDGLTIMPDAFKHQDKIQVPLVWQHGHTDPDNVLGHVLLENRDEGVYCHAYFNATPKAVQAKALVEHKDINSLSIWANELIQKSKQVLHGKIREVSLVLAGANPGAVIENVTLRHGEGIEDEILEDEALIFTGLEIELHHSVDTKPEVKKEDLKLSDKKLSELKHDEDDPTVEDIYNTMSDEQKQVLHYLVGEAMADSAEHSGLGEDEEIDLKELYESMPDDQKQIFHTMVAEATANESKGNEMKHNVFETKDAEGNVKTATLSHADMEGIVGDATKNGSLKEAVQEYALAHGIQDIDVLFPEARNAQDAPELFARRQEWVSDLLGKVKKSPFSRIKTMSADLTVAEARAKGYITGALKKEEFFRVKSRVTQPTTIYKKQKLDRDDMIDITDFDVVDWLKGEMRLMLDEEIARAILVGDGRESDDEDKVNEEAIRPIATDHELYVTQVYVNIGDSNSSIMEALDAIVLQRQHYRGTGLPTLYTTETYIAKFLLVRDTTGRKIYKGLDEVATDLRFAAIVPVEILNEYPNIIGIVVNPIDYTVGADKGGNVSMFDDFDIDYNQYKYLIETRISGSLTKLKAAMVINKTADNSVLVVPAEPAFDGDQIIITDQAGVIYRNAATDAVMNNAGSPYAVADDVTVTVTAEPASGAYYFSSSNDDEWSFTGTA